MATTVTPSGARVHFSPPNFLSALSAEWTKVTSVRSNWTIFGLGVALAILSSAGLSAAVGATWSDIDAQQRAQFDTLPVAFFGTLFSTIFFCVLGVNAVVSEYSSGMIRLTLAVTPRRTQVLLAKASVISGATLVGGLLVAFGTVVASQTLFEAYDVPARSLGDPGVLRAVTVVAVTSPLFPLIGLALGFLLRTTASALTAILAFVFVPGIFGPLLPVWWQQHFLRFLPAYASESLAMNNPDSILHLPTATAIAVVLGWLVLALSLAFTNFLRRDA